MTLPDIVGTLAALCSIVSFLPQIAKIIRERSAEQVSLRTYALTVSAFSLWTCYGALIGSWPVIVSNSVAFALAATTLFLKRRFTR
jgi:MtN3 and saliva related transmembrane protein